MASEKPTRMRHVVLLMALAVAVLLYLDRYCLSTADRDIKRDLGLEEAQVAILLGAFFLPYALGQIPLGLLADRFGPRRMLSLLMFLWSGCTALLGFAQGFSDFYVFRFGCGLFEAGGYPACAGIIKRWIPVPQRGFASGVVSFGGRLGGAITPWLTATLMTTFAVLVPQHYPWRPTLWLFGVVGILLAIGFYFFFRDTPAEHPGVNAAERALIAGDAAPPPVALAEAITAGTPPAVPALPVQGPSIASRVFGAGSLVGLAAVALVTLLFFGSTLTLWTVGITIVAAAVFGALAPELWLLAGNSNLWTSNFIQFGANFGQVFVATNLNRYLVDIHGVNDIGTRGQMVSATFVACLPALLIGGWLVDAMVRRFGVRWGIALPMALPRFAAAFLFTMVPVVMAAWPIGPGESPLARAWVIVGILAMASFCADLTLPAIWAFNLSVGGKIVGLVLGWGNMWGNLGAWRSPNDIHTIVTSMGWDAVFMTVAFIFFLIAMAALSIDAREKMKAA